MSYSKDHSRKNPLAPSRMYGMSSSANTNTTPIDSEPKYSTYTEGKEGEDIHQEVDFSAHGFNSFSDAVKHRDAMKKQHGGNWRSQPGMEELQADINKRLTKPKPKVEDKVKKETIPMERIDARLIDTSSRMPSLRTIQTNVPEVGMASSISPEKPTKIKEKRDFNFNLDKLKPNVNLGKSFSKNTITNRKGQFKGGGRKTKGFFARDFQGKLKIFNR